MLQLAPVERREKKRSFCADSSAESAVIGLASRRSGVYPEPGAPSRGGP